METKQTALQWLLEQWPILESQIPQAIINNVLQMEREQILRDYEFGLHNGVCHCHGDRLINSPEYYKETYGGKDE
jgi:hypothetical protein